MTDDSASAIREHAVHSRQYLEKALITLQQGEAGKSGELLGGSVAQALQAFAAYKNQPVRTHRELKNLARLIASETEDESLEKDFILAESLHNNFYTVKHEPADIATLVPTIQGLVAKLFALLPRDLSRSVAVPESESDNLEDTPGQQI